MLVWSYSAVPQLLSRLDWSGSAEPAEPTVPQLLATLVWSGSAVPAVSQLLSRLVRLVWFGSAEPAPPLARQGSEPPGSYISLVYITGSNLDTGTKKQDFQTSMNLY
jgi:hypothetical protein